MTRPKKQTAPPLSYESLMKGVDPLQVAVMTMGGIASASGLKGPLTQLLIALNSQAAGDIWHAVSTPGYQLIGEWLSGGGGDSQDVKDKRYEAIAYFCAGAVEAAIMYQLVSNPETFKQMIALPGKVVEGVGKIIP